MGGYEKDGYEVVRQAIPPADLGPFRACIAEQVGVHAAELLNEGKISDPYEDAPFGRRLAALHSTEEFPARPWNNAVFGPEIQAPIEHRERFGAVFWI